MNTKGALRKILSNLHPNTILKPNLDSNAHPQPSGGGPFMSVIVHSHHRVVPHVAPPCSLVHVGRTPVPQCATTVALGDEGGCHGTALC